MKPFLFALLGCLASTSAYAGSCGAVRYECDHAKKEMRITYKEQECGGGSPFKYFDGAQSGLYDDSKINKPIIKKCLLGERLLTMVVTGECERGGETAAGVRVFGDRDNPLYLNTSGSQIDTASVPIVFAPRFGTSCGSNAMVFESIIVKLLDHGYYQTFSVQMK